MPDARNNRRISADTADSAVLSCNGILFQSKFTEATRLVHRDRALQKTLAVFCRKEGNADENKSQHHHHCDAPHGLRFLHDGKKRNMGTLYHHRRGLGMPYHILCVWRENDQGRRTAKRIICKSRSVKYRDGFLQRGETDI